MIFGLDIPGAVRFSKEAIRAIPKRFALGFFLETFGDAWPLIKRLSNSKESPLFRVHATWEDDHKYIPSKHDRRIKAHFVKFLEISGMAPGMRWQFSPFCEVDGDLTNILRELHREAPDVELVNSVWRGPFQKRILASNEIHGDHAKPRGKYNFSTDGESSVDLDIQRLKLEHKRAEVFFFWHASFNGKRNDEDRTPRPDRTFWPTPELIQSIAFQASDRGPAHLPQGWLYKSHADVHQVPPEPRAYKPVLLAPRNVPHIDIVTKDGQRVARLPYYGPFDDGTGRSRYYADSYGYKIAERAIALSGLATCSLVCNGDQIGTINPGFRCGGFR